MHLGTLWVGLTCGVALVAQSSDLYPLTADHNRQAGVPEGKVTKHSWTSKIYPGTVRDYWVYVPAQYKADKAACVMIMQDGGGMIGEKSRFRAEILMDNLIHKGEMPVTIGIFINPGVLRALDESQQSRYNRSFEYDALSDRYARFLIDEILPEVGKSYNLSKDPNDRGLGGSSSGAIAAFNAAWHRPDAFRRVISYIGTYTNVRGGQAFPTLIRKTEPKPLRVFLQDGKKDLNIYAGNWWIANQDMASSLEFAGYEHKVVFGEEAHNGIHGSALLPDALRYIWSGYPAPVKAGTGKGERNMVSAIGPVGDWEEVSSGYGFTEGPAVDKNGDVYFVDARGSTIHKVEHATKKVSLFAKDTGNASGLMFGADGRLYACGNRPTPFVSAYTMDGRSERIAEGMESCNDLAVTKNNEIYFTDPRGKKVWFVSAKGEKKPVVNEGLSFPNGIRLSPDQALVVVADSDNKWVWSYQVQPDGSLANGQAFYRLETPDEGARSGADGMTFDTEGFLYVTTSVGLQICDQPGRVNAILNKPQMGSLSNVVFGGPQLDTLYVTAGDKVFRRKVLRKGLMPWTVVKPPVPRL